MPEPAGTRHVPNTGRSPNSSAAASATYQADLTESQAVVMFNGNLFYSANNLPFSSDYSENAAGQLYVAAGSEKRASFADAAARHQMLYSRFHKSRYFCATCHDVSNPVLANLAHFYYNESCGQCTPCREGTGWLARVIHRIEHGQGRPEDLDNLDRIAGQIGGHTICAPGDAAAMPVQSFIKHYRDEFEYHIEHKKCMVAMKKSFS